MPPRRPPTSATPFLAARRSTGILIPPPTIDIDVAVEPDEESISAFIAELDLRGIRSTSQEIHDRGIATVILVDGKSKLKVEVMSGYAPSHISAVVNAVRVRVGAVSFNLVTPEDLIVNKAMAYFDRHERKDMCAVVDLLRIKHGKLDEDHMTSLMGREGREAVFRTIMNIAKRGLRKSPLLDRAKAQR